MSIFNKAKSQIANKRMFTTSSIIRMLIPLLLTYILNITVGTVNSIMVSQAGEAAVSGVSLVNVLDNMLILFFTSLVVGGSVVISQALGTRNTETIRGVAKQLIYAVTITALVLSVVVLIFGNSILNFLFGDAEAEVMANAKEYFFIVALSFPLLGISEAIAGCFRAAGNTVVSLIATMTINIVNIVGNAIFVIALDMGAAGSATATLLARAVGAVFLLILIHNKKYPVHVEKLFSYKPDFEIIKRILGIGVPNGTENILFQFGRLMTQSLISALATAAIAANSVSLDIVSYQYAVNYAFGAAMVTVVGRCIGAGDEGQARYYSKVLLFMNYAVLLIVVTATLAFIRPILSLYDISAEAKAISVTLVTLHSLIAALIYPLGFLLPSTFRAASDVRFTLVASMLSMWCLRVALAYFMALDTVSVFGLFTFKGLGMGILGVWVAMMFDWVMRSALYLIRYISGRWLKAYRLQGKI